MKLHFLLQETLLSAAGPIPQDFFLSFVCHYLHGVCQACHTIHYIHLTYLSSTYNKGILVFNLSCKSSETALFWWKQRGPPWSPDPCYQSLASHTSLLGALLLPLVRSLPCWPHWSLAPPHTGLQAHLSSLPVSPRPQHINSGKQTNKNLWYWSQSRKWRFPQQKVKLHLLKWSEV